MGAVVPPTHWIPEDDVLLRNAVEAGASLESLAKGAVKFSQRYTLRELQDRWYSLLYDPDVSEEASVHMIGLEHSGLTYQSKSNKSESMKETTSGSSKRTAESIRKCYYAMRKRIRNESLDLINMDLLPSPCNFNFGDCNNPSSAVCLMENPVLNNSGTHGPQYDSWNQYSQFGTAESTGIGVIPSFTDNRSLHLGGQDLSNHFSCPAEVPQLGQSNELPLCNLVEVNGLDGEENPRSEFGSTPFHDFDCSSSLPDISIWNTSSGHSPIQIGNEDQQTRDTFLLSGANDANVTKDYFEELSNKLLDFTNEDELLLMDTDGNDTLDKSYIDGFSSLLLDSPNQTNLPKVDVDEVIEGNFVAHPEGSFKEELDYCEPNIVTEALVPSPISSVKGFGPEYRNGIICCRLNMEDSEIPSNDDVFLPFRFPSPSSSSGGHRKLPSSDYNFSGTRKPVGKPLMTKTKQKDTSILARVKGSSKSSDRGSKNSTEEHRVKFELPKSDIHPAGLRNSRKSECQSHVNSETANANTFIAKVVNGGATKMERGKLLDSKYDGAFLDKHVCGPEIPQGSQNIGNDVRNEVVAQAETPNILSSNGVSREKRINPKTIDESLLSDHEELSENDFDVPYFSDVEALILDMDLIPDEFDILTKPEVQQYRHEETKRTIIKLEQAANACMQRALTVKGAFAVLYGRHTKHIINKTEVILGRGTEDVEVDINFGREKNGGKISRRQASITMDMHGSFLLKNLGKCSIFVNDKEVARGQSLCLPPGCFIEVRGLAYVFETNQKGIRQYLDSIRN